MTMINMRGLGFQFAEPLFANLNATIGPADRIGLVAANGRGKSTLLRCLAGEVEPVTGEITRSRGLRAGYVAQEIPVELLGVTFRALVQQALFDPTEDWRVDVALDELDVPEEFRGRFLHELSGGWQRLAMLARAWVSEPDVLLLDEPTNHLDLSRIGRLQGWLKALPREFPVVIASHDRAFLDEVTNRTLFLRVEKSAVFGLPFTRARLALEELDAADSRKFDNDMAKAQQLRKQAAKLKNIGINSGSDLLITKTKQLKDRADKIEEAARPGFMDRSAGAIKLGNSGTHAKALVTLDDVPVCTPDGGLLFKTGKLWIERGDRVVLLGRNGAGKTQMVKAVQAAFGGAGVIKVAPSVVLGYSDQGLAQVADRDTPAEVISERFDVGDQAARTMLAGVGVNVDMQAGPIGKLSGGQKARLAMLVLRLTRPNFYLLDEPTNHLDIDGQEALEGELLANGAACLLVSHDRSFVRNVGNRFWLIEGKRLREVEDAEGFFKGEMG